MLVKCTTDVGKGSLRDSCRGPVHRLVDMISVLVQFRRHSKEVARMLTTTDRSILSTCSITLLEVLLSIIVLQAAQVLRQSSGGMVRRALVKGESAVSNNSVCVNGVGVLFFCDVVDMLMGSGCFVFESSRV